MTPILHKVILQITCLAWEANFVHAIIYTLSHQPGLYWSCKSLCEFIICPKLLSLKLLLLQGKNLDGGMLILCMHWIMKWWEIFRNCSCKRPVSRCIEQTGTSCNFSLVAAAVVVVADIRQCSTNIFHTITIDCRPAGERIHTLWAKF